MTPANPKLSKEQAGELLSLYQTLKTERAPWEVLWKEIARYVCPRRSPGIQGSVSSPSTEDESNLFDSTAGQSAMTLANGCLAGMSPQESPWFTLAPEDENDEDATRWLNKATRTTRDALARSNFYTEVHEFYLDRSAFGTGCLYCEPSSKRSKRLNVQNWPVGSYVFDEDEEGDVDTVIREMILTPRTAVKKFGKENVSAVIKEKAEKGGATATEQIKFLHFILPRAEADQKEGSFAPEHMPIASIYMEEAGAHVVKVSGYEEMPVFVSRYLIWGSNLGRRWGWTPSLSALPEARQLNFLQMMLDALAERKAFPSILSPETLEGEIDSNAGAVTYYASESAGSNKPEEWLTGGKYEMGKDRVIERQAAIKSAYHTDVFQMFASLTKQMTAREVAERSAEKLTQVSPTFARLTTELFNPLLERVFGISLRKGWLGQVPENLVEDLGDGTGFVPPPRVLYSSKIAMALRAEPKLATLNLIESVSVMAGPFPEVLDNINPDAAYQAIAGNESIPDGVNRTKADVAKLRQARSEAAAQQAQQAQAMMAAEQAAKLGRVPENSPVGQAIGEQLKLAS